MPDARSGARSIAGVGADKENRPRTTTAGSGEGKAAASKIARPASRASTTPSEPKPTVGPATRSRIGVQTRATASAIPRTGRPSSVLGNRPPSSLASHSALPTASVRRPSVTGPPAAALSPASAGLAAKTEQLEAELATAHETISSLQNSLAEVEINASTLSASLRSTQTDLEARSSQVSAAEEAATQARAESEAVREECDEMKEEHAVELSTLRNEHEQERRDAVSRIEALELRCRSLEQERDELAGSREELERLLADARVDRADLDALEEARDEAETELAWHEEELQKLEDLRAADRTTIKTLRAELEDADNVIADLERENEELRTTAALPSSLKHGAEEPSERCDEMPADPPSEGLAEQPQVEVTTEIKRIEADRNRLIVVLAACARAHRGAADRLATSAAARRALGADLATRSEELDRTRDQLATAQLQSGDIGAKLADAVAEIDLQARAATDAADAHAIERETADNAAAAQAIEMTHLEERISLLQDELADKTKAMGDMQNRLEEIACSTSDHDAVSTLQRQLEEANFDRDQAEEELRLAEARNADLEADLARRAAADAAGTGSPPGASDIAYEAQPEAEREDGDSAARGAAVDDDDTRSVAAELAAERTFSARAREETQAVEEALMDAQEQIRSLEGIVASRQERITELEAACKAAEERAAQTDDLEEALAEAEQQLVSVTFELDDLRAKHDDLAQAALQDSAERQAQSDEHDELLELYNRRALETDSLRKILAETEAHADSLAWQLREKESAAVAVDRAHQHEREDLIERIEFATAEQDRLRLELDEAKHRLSDAQDALEEQAVGDVSTVSLARSVPAGAFPGSPSPADYSFAAAPSPDPAALLMRLREERDELRDRLDFARQEAKHRMHDLQDRLRRMDEVKAHEVSVLQLDLMDKQAAYETEREMNVKLEQAARDAKQHRDQLVEEMTFLERRIVEADATIEVLTSELAEAQLRAEQSSAEATDAALTKARLFDAQEALETVQLDLDAARARLEANERTGDVEPAAAETDPLADLASLCEAMPAPNAQPAPSLLGLEATLHSYEERLALLQLNLAMRVALDDEDTEAEGDQLPEADPDATFVADPIDELNTLRADLAVASDQHENTRTRLEAVEHELQGADLRRQEAASRMLTMQGELSDLGIASEAREAELVQLRVVLAEVAARESAAEEALRHVEATAQELQRDLDRATDRSARLEMELSDARSQAVSARQAAEQAQENAERLSGELDEALAALDASKSECSEWQTRATSIEQDSTTRIEHLEGELARETGRSTESRQQVEEVRRRVTQLETQLEAAQVEARTANEEHARLAERVTKLDNDRHLAMQENQTLRRLGQSSVAEAETLATEVASLKTQFKAELKAANELATRNLTEVITELENRERGQLAADERARQLEAELERERAQPHGPSADELARIAELEKTLEAQKLDVEDTDEKLIEALKVQKKSAALIERLKAKIASLQRDIAAAKSLQQAPATILAAAPLPPISSSPAIGRKRPAPSEFEVKPDAPPRAIAQAPSSNLNKENSASSARRQQRTLSSVKPPVKEAAASAPRREALAPRDDNKNVAVPTHEDVTTDKIAALNARLQNFRRPKSAEIV